MSDKDYLAYDRSADTIVKQTRSTLYSDPGDQALYKIIDLHFLGFEWIQLASWENDTDQTDTYEHSYSTQFTIRTGQEVNNQWNFGGDFKGLSLGVGGSTTTITEQEVTTTKSYTVTVNVGPTSAVYFYQKRYYFKPVVWFKLDAWGKLWTVGNWERAGVAALSGNVEIDANEYLTRPAALSGSGTLSVTAWSDVWAQDNIKQFQDCTRKCQDYLHDRGV